MKGRGVAKILSVAHWSCFSRKHRTIYKFPLTIRGQIFLFKFLPRYNCILLRLGYLPLSLCAYQIDFSLKNHNQWTPQGRFLRRAKPSPNHSDAPVPPVKWPVGMETNRTNETFHSHRSHSSSHAKLPLPPMSRMQNRVFSSREPNRHGLNKLPSVCYKHMLLKSWQLNRLIGCHAMPLSA